jgi:hypothetical protein
MGACINSLPNEIDKLETELEAEARSIVEKDIADLRTWKAVVFERARKALNDTCDVVQDLAVRLRTG